jgi:hypothetical protein
MNPLWSNQIGGKKMNTMNTTRERDTK